MFQTPTTQVWKRMFNEGKLNEAQSHFWKTKPAEELYDLQTDPDEVNNLISFEDHKATAKVFITSTAGLAVGNLGSWFSPGT